METDPNIMQGVVYYLIANQEHIKQKVSPFTRQRERLLSTDNNVFKEEIDKQYHDVVKSTIGDEITSKLGIPIEDVLIILENLNVEEYIK